MSSARLRLRLWGWPVAIALVTASGLASALVSDGWGDVWSWIALGVPVAVMTWFPSRRNAKS
jgi:hypothetical protein